MSRHPDSGAGYPPPYAKPHLHQPQPPQQPIMHPPMHPQMVNQQQSTTNIVMINQPQVEGQKLILGPVSGHRDWTTSLFSCCEDIGSCLWTWCCPTCVLWSIASRLGENVCVADCIPGGTILLRTRLRTLGGIRGSICNDYCAVGCCPLCAISQMDRELKNMGL